VPGGHRPTPELVERIYQRAIADEAAAVQLWPDAREYQRKMGAELGFSETAEAWIRKSRRANRQPQDVEDEIERACSAHRAAVAKHLPKLVKYKPSELLVANLQKAWEPYAELLLDTAKSLQGNDFGEFRPMLIQLGFHEEILRLCREDQKRRYFLQQTPASMARAIATQRHYHRIGNEEVVRAAEKRLYSHLRPKSKRKK
jgi:hypothetical protein